MIDRNLLMEIVRRQIFFRGNTPENIDVVKLSWEEYGNQSVMKSLSFFASQWRHPNIFTSPVWE